MAVSPAPARSALKALGLLLALLAAASTGCRCGTGDSHVSAVASTSAAPSSSSLLPSSASATASDPPNPSLSPAPRKLRGGLDVTFLVAADTHFGFGRPSDDTTPIDRSRPVGIEAAHDRTVAQMRAMATRRWPSLARPVSRPRGLIVAGDLTEDGSLHQWNRFLAWYGDERRGPGIPLYETLGNHDRIRGDVIAKEVAKRHGSEFYSWDWDDLHVAVLGESPNDRSLPWLHDDLLRAGPHVPIIVVLHYALAGPFSVDEWKTEGGYYDRFRNALNGYRIVGIFHGHYHVAGGYRWHGHDVYRVGSAKYVHRSFVAVRVTDHRMTVAAWNTDAQTWWWWHDKRISGDPDLGVLQTAPLEGIEPPEFTR